MLEKLYDVLYDKKLFTQDYNKFKQAWSDEEYKKKVYEVVSSRRLFTQDYNTFVNSYSEGKQQGDVATDAAAEPGAVALASTSEITSSDLSLPIPQTEGPADPDAYTTELGLTYGDQRTAQQQIEDYMRQMDQVLSATGKFEFLADKTLEERYYFADKAVPTPTGSPKDIKLSYYNYFVDRKVKGIKDPKAILEPLFLSKSSLKDDYLKRKGDLDIKDFYEQGGTEDLLIKKADDIVDKMIHESDYMNKEFMPYFFKKYEEDFYNKQIEIIKSLKSEYIGQEELNIIEEQLEKYQLDILNQELASDVGYRDLVANVTTIASEDLGIDIKAFNKTKVIPNWAEGSDFLEGIYRFTKQWASGEAGENMASISKQNKGIDNFLKAYQSGEYTEQELIEIAKENLTDADVMLLYPSNSVALSRAQWIGADQYEELVDKVRAGIKDPVSYLKKKKKFLNKQFINSMQDSEELSKVLSIMDSTEFFDEDGVTLDDFQRMAGEQLPQMAQAILTLGYGTYMQEAGGIYVESMYKIAEAKYGEMALAMASPEQKEQMFLEIMEAGEDNPDEAIEGGIINAGLDFGSSIFVVTKAGKFIPKQAWRSLLRGEFKKAIKKAGGKNLLEDALKISMAESITEASQETVSMIKVGKSTGYYDFDPKRIKEGAAQGFASSLLFFGLGKGRSVFSYLGNEAAIEYSRFTNKDHILNLLKLEKQKIKNDLQNESITKDEARNRVRKVNAKRDAIIDNDVYNTSDKNRQAVLDAIDVFVDEQIKLENAQNNLDQVKNNNRSTDQDIEFRESEVNNQKEKMADANFEVQKLKVLDNYNKNKGKAANRVNSTTEGDLANKQVFTFKTRKQAAAFVKRYNINVDKNIQNMLDGNANGVAAVSPITYKGKEVVPALIVDQNIRENILKTSRQSDGGILSAFAESHEVNHFILDAIDPKIINNLVSKLRADMRNSQDPQTLTFLNAIEAAQQQYLVNDPTIDTNTLNQEFITALGDLISLQNTLEIKSPLQRAFGKFGESMSNIINSNTGLNVDYSNPNSVLSFFKNYNKFLGKNAPIVLKGSTDVYGEKSRAQISLEKQKDLLVNENKALVPMMRTNAAAAKKIAENVARIAELNTAIKEQIKDRDNLKFPTGLSEKAKNITRQNELNFSELMDPKTSDADKDALRNQIYTNNEGIIFNTVKKQFNPEIDSNLTVEDFTNAYKVEMLEVIRTYEKNYFKNKKDNTLAPFGAYAAQNLPLRQGNILRRLIGDKSMMFTGDSTTSVGSSQLSYEPDYGNFNNQEYVQQQGVVVADALGFTPEIKKEIKEAARKVLLTFKGSSSVKIKKELGDALEVLLKPYIQTNVLGSKIKKNYKGQTYREYMQQNWESVYSIIGFDVINSRLSSQTRSEKAAGIQNPFIFKFTDSDGKQKRDSRFEDLTGKGRGKAKKRKVTQPEFIAFFFGDKVAGSTQGTRKDTLAEIIAREAGLDQISYMLENDAEFIDLFKERQELLGNLIDDNYIENLQKQIDRFDGSRRPGSRAQLVIDSANYNDLSSSVAIKILDDIKNNEIIDYKSSNLNRFRNDVLDIIRKDNAYVAVDLYHTPSNEDIIKDGVYKVRNEGFHVSTVKNPGDKTVRLKISSAGNLFVPREFKWRDSNEYGMDVELQGYDQVITSLDNLTELDSPYFGKWLVDNNILTKKQVESDPRSDGLRYLLLKEGYTSITYPKNEGGIGYIVLDNEAFNLSFDTKVNNTIKGLMSDTDSRAQLVGMKKTMNEIIEQKSKGKIKANELLSNAAARNMRRKAGVNFSNLYVPYQLEDFIGLTYAFTPEGKKGEAAQEFIKERVMNPYFEAKEQYRLFNQNLNKNFNRLVNDVGITKKTLKETVDLMGKPFTKDQIVRIYLFSTQGADIDPSILSAKELEAALDYINSDEKLLSFAALLPTILDNKGSWVQYRGEMHETLSIDIVKHAESKRKVFFEKFKDNTDIIFGPQIKEKLRGLLGDTYVKELESSLRRMYTGKNENKNSGNLENLMTWFNGSVNTIMFFNMRSAMLQLMSTVNFINWSDNNVMAAAKAFGNQKQYWSDVYMLLNTSYLKDRRDSLKFDIEADKLVEMGRTSKSYSDFLNKLFKLGYTPTRVADSLAIALGGSTFYRNRFNSYKKQGLSDAEAEAKALVDFERTAELSQQSSDPSKISSAQIGAFGRFIFAFANTPFQYARLSKRAALDILNNRGDLKTNVSKLTYYTFVQSALFSMLQNLISIRDLIDFGDEEEEDMDENTRSALYFAINSTIDSQLKNFGAGVGASAIWAKNLGLLYYQRELYRQNKEKGGYGDLISAKRPTVGDMVLALSSPSPPMSNKVRQAFNIDRMNVWQQYRQKKDFYDLTDTWYIYPQDPAWTELARYMNVIGNIPADRLVQKLENLSFAMSDELDFSERLMFGLGWSKWNLLPKDQFDMAYPEMKTLDFYENKLRQKREDKSKNKNSETIHEYERRMREKRQEKSK